MIHAVMNTFYSDRALAIPLWRGLTLFGDGHFHVLTSNSPNVCRLNPLSGVFQNRKNQRLMLAAMKENKQDGGKIAVYYGKRFKEKYFSFI
jgi:hypothetical protein